MIKVDFRLETTKKRTHLWETAMIEQIVEQNDDNTLGILKANLELKHMFIICS